MTRLATAILLVAALAPAARAQCVLKPSSNEARLLAFYAAPIAFSPDAAPGGLRPGSIRIGGEIAPVPTPSADLERTSACGRPKSERTRLSPIFGRPRLTVGLPFGFWVEGSYLPPVTISNAQPELASLAVGAARTVHGGGRPITVALRAHTTFGKVRGPITCPEESLQQADETASCYGTRESRDTYRPDMRGIEAMVATAVHPRVRAYVGGGMTWLEPRFRVGFDEADGDLDRTLLVVDLTRATVFAGATADIGRRLDLSLQAYSVPTDATTLRAALAYRLR